MSGTAFTRRQVLASSALILVAAPARAHAGTVHVTIDRLTFTPAEVTVRAGETIEWVNEDPIAHTATVEGGWEVMIPPGESAVRVVEAGDTVDYYCRFHPNMKGRIVVTA